MDEDLWSELVVTYARFEGERIRFVVASNIVGVRPLSTSEATSLRETSNELGRVRRRLQPTLFGGWPDEINE